MGESFATPADNATSPSLPQPARSTSSSLVNEDDDEPPSSGSLHGSSEMRCPGVDKTLEEGTFTTKLESVPPTQTSVPRSQPQALSVSARLRTLFTPAQPLGPRPTYKASALAAVKYTPLNVCLVFIPVSWALHFTNQSATIVFIFSALGIVPLAALLGFGTEQIAIRTSQSVGGLLNATLGNIVEMIIAGIALKRCELELVQSSLLGGLLSNLLLVLGMAFIVGGFRFHQQEFHPMVAQLNSSLMIVCVTSLIVPVAFHEYLEDRLAPGKEVGILLQLSRGSAIILILIYIAYLVFQFYSHNHLFLDTCQTGSSISSKRSTLARVSADSLPTTCTSASSAEHYKLNAPFALFLLVASTALAYVTADHLVGSLSGLLAAHPNVSKEWITLVVIPVISNAAEHTTAVVVARKGKFDLAMSVAVGSCIQIALFVIPVLVLIAWGMDKPLTLLFDPLETVVLFFSVLLVKFSVEDGKSHWMSGFVMIAVYVIIALSFWNFPETSERGKRDGNNRSPGTTILNYSMGAIPRSSPMHLFEETL
ncbi:putative Ca(2) cation antiporter (CaCA) (TC 2.A.19) family protein [Lyophyllum shimeji]|uniref:Vacuolar calcium ion transporter n=1 Tax=Lyophyllum shimeji TaxID=47721 RepID=A0A9P3PU42_LYOSH|nr:putative Ca(2) cation antiporter (CaCA) (TC 2.A.19) family protein [Lyophyllum shimeji]